MLGQIPRRLWRHKLALGAFASLAVIITAALCAHVIAPFDPAEGNIADRLRPPSWHPGDGQRHLLGTDQIGRDVLSRLIYGFGSRCSLALQHRISLLTGAALGLWPVSGAGRCRALLRGTDIHWPSIIALAVV